jgi:hypothetical protein
MKASCGVRLYVSAYIKTNAQTYWKIFDYPFNSRLDALYGPLIQYMLLASVHRMVMSAVTGAVSFKPERLGHQFNWNPIIFAWLYLLFEGGKTTPKF